MTYNPNFTGAGIISGSKSTINEFLNDTGLTIVKGTPVKITAAGISAIDVGLENEIDGATGIVVSNISTGNTGEVVTSGRLEDITTTASIGSALYVSTLGTLTDIKPDVGINGFSEGDFSIIAGVVVTNLNTPSKKDLLVRIQLIGQL